MTNEPPVSETPAEKQVCQMCGDEVAVLSRIDVPADAVLCDGCRDEFSWGCDACLKTYADSRVDGGESLALRIHQADTVCRECWEECQESDSASVIEWIKQKRQQSMEKRERTAALRDEFLNFKLGRIAEDLGLHAK